MRRHYNRTWFVCRSGRKRTKNQRYNRKKVASHGSAVDIDAQTDSDSDDSLARTAARQRAIADSVRRANQRRQQVAATQPNAYDCEHSAAGSLLRFCDSTGFLHLEEPLRPFTPEVLTGALAAFHQQCNPFEAVKSCGSCGIMLLADDEEPHIWHLADLPVLRFSADVRIPNVYIF